MKKLSFDPHISLWIAGSIGILGAIPACHTSEAAAVSAPLKAPYTSTSAEIPKPTETAESTVETCAADLTNPITPEGMKCEDASSLRDEITVYPLVPTEMQCKAAQDWYVREFKRHNPPTPSRGNRPPDITLGASSSVLKNGRYLNECGVPPSTGVSICAAIQNGRAVGVTVSTTPPDPDINACLVKKIEVLSFPSLLRLDISRMQFEPVANPPEN